MRTTAPLQLGRKSPDDQPARDTRYQDFRLYARTLTAEEAKRLPYEDYAAEITSKPMSQWDRDQLHAVSDFYFNNVDESAKAINSQIQQLDAQLDKLSEGGDISMWRRKSLPLPMRMFSPAVFTPRARKEWRPIRRIFFHPCRPACRIIAWRSPIGR